MARVLMGWNPSGKNTAWRVFAFQRPEWLTETVILERDKHPRDVIDDLPEPLASILHEVWDGQIQECGIVPLVTSSLVAFYIRKDPIDHITGKTLCWEDEIMPRVLEALRKLCGYQQMPGHNTLYTDDFPQTVDELATWHERPTAQGQLPWLYGMS